MDNPVCYQDVRRDHLSCIHINIIPHHRDCQVRALGCLQARPILETITIPKVPRDDMILKVPLQIIVRPSFCHLVEFRHCPCGIGDEICDISCIELLVDILILSSAEVASASEDRDEIAQLGKGDGVDCWSGEGEDLIDDMDDSSCADDILLSIRC